MLQSDLKTQVVLVFVHELNNTVAAKMVVKVFIGFGFNCFMPTNVLDAQGLCKRIFNRQFLKIGKFAGQFKKALRQN